MPRYFFDTEDGRRVRDPEGTVFPDDHAARREGLSVLGEILRYQGDSFWNTGRFSVIVTEASGRPVVTLTTTAAGDAARDPTE